MIDIMRKSALQGSTKVFDSIFILLLVSERRQHLCSADGTFGRRDASSSANGGYKGQGRRANDQCRSFGDVLGFSHSQVWLYFAYLFSSRYVRLCMAAFICHSLGITFMAKKSSKSSKSQKAVEVLRTVFSSQCRSQMQIWNQRCQLLNWSIPQSFRYGLFFFSQRDRVDYSVKC